MEEQLIRPCLEAGFEAIVRCVEERNGDVVYFALPRWHVHRQQSPRSRRTSAAKIASQPPAVCMTKTNRKAVQKLKN